MKHKYKLTRSDRTWIDGYLVGFEACKKTHRKKIQVKRVRKRKQL